MIRRRDLILGRLSKRSYTTNQLAEDLGISEATVRKHIELLRKEGHAISYNRSDNRYYTTDGVDNMRRTESKLKGFIAQWIGSPTELQDQDTINKIYRALGEGAAELEEKTAQLVLRYIITHHTQQARLGLEAVQGSLGLDMELVQKVLGRLVTETVIARKQYGELTFYDFEEEQAEFIRAINKGYMTLTTNELDELFTVKEADRAPEDGGINSLAVYHSGGKKIYRWVPHTVPGFLIPGIFHAFTTSFSGESYEAMDGSKFSGHGSWEYMPPIIRFQQGPPKDSARQAGQGEASETIEVGLEKMVYPEGHIVDELIGQQRPDPYLYSLLGFGEQATAQQITRATTTVQRSKIASLLAYHKPLYEKIKKEGAEGLEAAIEKMRSIQDSPKIPGEFPVPRAKPSAWLTSAYLTMMGNIFRYASTKPRAEGLERYLSSLQEYSELFLQTAKELEARQRVQQEDLLADKSYKSLDFQISTGNIDPAEVGLGVRVDKVFGTSDTVQVGAHFAIKGRYTLKSPVIKSLCVACHGTSSGSMAYLSPGTGEFHTWGEIIDVQGHEKELSLLIFDEEKELGSITQIQLKNKGQ